MKPEENEAAEPAKGYHFNTFSGVFLPSILTILGVVMFMRLGTVTGELGIIGALGILLAAESIAVATGLSISAISTNTPVKNGGPYFLISRSLGPGFGASIGLTYYVSQSLSVPFYVIGFTEAFVKVFPQFETTQLWVGLIPLLVLFTIAIVGANWAIRTQYAIMAILALSIAVILASAAFGVPGPSAETFRANLYAKKGVDANILVLATNFAIFFPAVTGFLAGVNMSGDLKDARKSIPRGTILAIAAGFVIYLTEILHGIPLHYFAATQGEYIIAYDDRYDKDGEVKEVKLLDKTTNNWYDLMDESYHFYTNKTDNKDRFILSVRVERKKPSVPTEIDAADLNRQNTAPRKMLINDHVYILRGGAIYDITGKQLLNK